ncbi:hypothetical protein Syun_023304 [Stephania yunnanensis]|uniref:Uncharacterized protein n=1 Tax=Stephania yunnanensis TaxID=152371 RepID=A0AAP0HZG7_9MAGN
MFDKISQSRKTTRMATELTPRRPITCQMIQPSSESDSKSSFSSRTTIHMSIRRTTRSSSRHSNDTSTTILVDPPRREGRSKLKHDGDSSSSILEAVISRLTDAKVHKSAVINF